MTKAEKLLAKIFGTARQPPYYNGLVLGGKQRKNGKPRVGKISGHAFLVVGDQPGGITGLIMSEPDSK